MNDTTKLMFVQFLQGINTCCCLGIILAAFGLGFGIVRPAWLKNVFMAAAVVGAWMAAGAICILAMMVVLGLVIFWIRPSGLSTVKNIHAQVGESRETVGNTTYITRYYGWISRRDQYYRFRNGMFFLITLSLIIYGGVIAIIVAQQYLYWTGQKLW